MPKVKISEFSSTPANNTDIDSINIAEGCAPSGINDAIRELMAQLKDFQTGAVGDSFNGPVGTSTAAAGAFTTLSASSTLAVTGVATLTAQPILSSLTASRAVFTDASKGLVSNAITGTGNVVMSTSPTLVTPTLGVATATSLQGIIGNVTPAAGAFTTVDASGAVTLSGGTASGVTYLNGSKVLTSGSALTFDGTTLKTNTLLSTSNLVLSVDNAANSMFVGGGSFSPSELILESVSSTNWKVNGTERMRLTSTGLGIGTSSPTASKLHISGDLTATYGIRLQSTFGTGREWGFFTANSTNNLVIRDITASADRLTIDSAGNLGLGVTPSAWLTSSIYSAFQMRGVSLFGNSSSPGGYLFGNAYIDSGATIRYVTTGAASGYNFQGGTHVWNIAASGTAGNAITFTQAMTLDASGRLLVGYTSSSDAASSLEVSGPFMVGGSLAAHQTNRAVITYGSNEMALRAYGATSGTGFITLRTGGGGGSSDSERARITSGGYFKASNAGTYLSSTGDYHELRSSNDNYILYAINTRSTGNGPFGISVEYSAQDPNGTTNEFLQCVGTTTLRAEIRSNGGIANYSANDANLSDRREKTNFAPAKSYLDVICAIPVQTFNYIDQNLEEDGGLTLGVVAQDVQAVAPELVMESNWAGKDAEPKMRLSIYQTDLQYALMKALQELKADFDAYKASHP